ncbi:MAG: imidazole glycerol phosphate synthase subunit HisH [Oscillospiraceae bacterium]|jgi:glutamine amidotransferase|nr:imidazole glycerol phosphate synthase subunit HisH [Oscillospiraceae bacterium]
MIAVLDYGCGNLRSVSKALEYLGREAIVTGEAADVARASHVILPGVGAFADAIRLFRQSDNGRLEPALRDAVRRGKPVLGICLGMQLMALGSDEDGWHDGLGLFDAPVTRFPKEAGKVPHMGWNQIDSRGGTLFEGVERSFVYFVHSYRIEGIHAWTAASCGYGGEFTAAVQRGNLCGAQFHPEKSGAAGLRVLRNFAGMGDGGC